MISRRTLSAFLCTSLMEKEKRGKINQNEKLQRKQRCKKMNERKEGYTEKQQKKQKGQQLKE